MSKLMTDEVDYAATSEMIQEMGITIDNRPTAHILDPLKLVQAMCGMPREGKKLYRGLPRGPLCEPCLVEYYRRFGKAWKPIL
jgi:hypothetical protein